jgi:hypothetical protein
VPVSAPGSAVGRADVSRASVSPSRKPVDQR